jgi:hypothetical protein
VDPLEAIYNWLVREGLKRFGDIIDDVLRVEAANVLVKVRIIMVDGSFLDVYWSPTGRYSLHYERRHVDGRVYRHDNAPHPRHRGVPTFPKHYHKGSEGNVVESRSPDEPVEAVERFLEEIRAIIKASSKPGQDKR